MRNTQIRYRNIDVARPKTICRRVTRPSRAAKRGIESGCQAPDCSFTSYGSAAQRRPAGRGSQWHQRRSPWAAVMHLSTYRQADTAIPRSGSPTRT